MALLAVYRNDQFVEGLTLGQALGGRTVHRFELGLPTSLRLSERWSFEMDPRVVHGSDLQGNHNDAWYPWVRSGFNWSVSPTLILGASVLFTQGLLGLVPVPLFSMYWRPDGIPFRIDALAPRYVEVAYRKRRLEVFWTFHWESGVWAVDRTDRVEGEPEDVNLLIRQEIRLHGGVRFRVLGPLGIEAAAQWVPWQRLELEDGAGQSFTDADDVAFTVSIILDKLAPRGPPER